jgi:hypothetical protein
MLQGGVDTLVGGEDFDAFYFYDYTVAVSVATPAAGTGGVGRAKITEGASPLPRDRVFFDYGYFGSVPVGNATNGLSRFTPGFEKSFFSGLASVEMRFPFASNVNADLISTGSGLATSGSTEFGNIALYGKLLMLRHDWWAISAGFGVIMPTADGSSLNLSDGTPLLAIDNQATYLQPFLGFLAAPSDRLFAQGFVQCDLAASGNSVALNTTGTGLTHVGKLTDANHVFVDLGLGYWLYRDDSECASILTGIIPMLELHYTGAISDSDIVTAGPFQVGNLGDDLSMLNFVAGTTFQFARGGNLSVAYTGSLTDSGNRHFDGGLRVLYSR